jgi:hypothetical protein
LVFASASNISGSEITEPTAQKERPPSFEFGHFKVWMMAFLGPLIKVKEILPRAHFRFAKGAVLDSNIFINE